MKLFGTIVSFLMSTIYFTEAHPSKFSSNEFDKQRMLSTNNYSVEKVNRMNGISCDLCMRAVYGVNYDFIQLKKDVIEMIRLDCEALFHDQAENISQCIRFLTTKVEKYSGKVEKILDSRHVCVLLRVCAVEENANIMENIKMVKDKSDFQ
uniref:Saposin B-type domain-containing protein n=1 Tax=Caenorhabditis japonica TaxID=281687 RepID=A0A8R1EFE2_CAEJA